jgi:hypothetical protein
MTEKFTIQSERGSFSTRQLSVGHTLLEVVRAVSLIRNGTVLDLFTGDGASIAPIQRLVVPERIICAEHSRGAVTVGLRNGRFSGVAPEDILIEGAEEAVERLAYTGAQVDLITGFGLSDEYISQPHSFLSGMQSIVRPHGAILMTGPEDFVEGMFEGWQRNYGGEFVIRQDPVHDWDRNMYLWVKQ